MTNKELQVAPYVGAWIETRIKIKAELKLASHPMWVRGLKPEDEQLVIPERPSHPMWVRGLKQPSTSR